MAGDTGTDAVDETEDAADEEAAESPRLIVIEDDSIDSGAATG
jgi:hypothetical protein